MLPTMILECYLKMSHLEFQLQCEIYQIRIVPFIVLKKKKTLIRLFKNRIRIRQITRIQSQVPWYILLSKAPGIRLLAFLWFDIGCRLIVS